MDISIASQKQSIVGIRTVALLFDCKSTKSLNIILAGQALFYGENSSKELIACLNSLKVTGFVSRILLR